MKEKGVVTILALKERLKPLYGRVTLWWFRFGQAGRRVHVNHTVRVTGASHISIGDDVHVHYRSELCAGTDGEITLADSCRLGPYATLVAGGGFIRVGRNSYVGPQAILRGDGGLEIGENALISPQVVMMSAEHIFADPSVPIYQQGETRRGIMIEDDVWIGAGAKVLDGVRIGHGAVIGAGAVVTRDVPPLAVAVGVPARVLKLRTDRAGAK